MQRNEAKRQPRSLARLDRQRRTLGITLAEVAAEATKTTRRRRRTVGITTVSSVINGWSKSANVVNALKRLIESKAQAAA